MELQRIKLLEDRTQYPRVRVFDDKWKERICLYIDTLGRAVCVLGDEEVGFLQGEDYNVCEWAYWEEIKEPAYRPYKEGGDLSHLLGAKIKNIKTGVHEIILFIGP